MGIMVVSSHSWQSVLVLVSVRVVATVVSVGSSVGSTTVSVAVAVSVGAAEVEGSSVGSEPAFSQRASTAGRTSSVLVSTAVHNGRE